MKTCFCCRRRGLLSLNCNCQHVGTCRKCLNCTRHCRCDSKPAPLTPSDKQTPKLTDADLRELDRITGGVGDGQFMRLDDRSPD